MRRTQTTIAGNGFSVTQSTDMQDFLAKQAAGRGAVTKHKGNGNSTTISDVADMLAYLIAMKENEGGANP